MNKQSWGEQADADNAELDPLSSLKHMSDDMKRVVMKLNTAAATEVLYIRSSHYSQA